MDFLFTLITLSVATQNSCVLCQFFYENVQIYINISVPLSCLTTYVCDSSSCQVFQSKDIPEKSTTPEEFIRMTKGITIATAKAVAAGNSAQQEDVIATANLSRKAISDMLTTCKVLIQTHPARTGLTQAAPGCQGRCEPSLLSADRTLESSLPHGCSHWL